MLGNRHPVRPAQDRVRHGRSASAWKLQLSAAAVSSSVRGSQRDPFTRQAPPTARWHSGRPPTRSTLSWMAFVGWSDRPAAVDAQVRLIAEGVERVLQEDLVGTYLHGSLVFGCCNPMQSDLDLLVVTRARLRASAREVIDVLFREVSRRPLPLEISILAEPTLRGWRHPARYELALQRAPPAAGVSRPEHGPDLAAHFTVARERGIALFGPPPRLCFPTVPWHDYVLAILGDFQLCLEAADADLRGLDHLSGVGNTRHPGSALEGKWRALGDGASQRSIDRRRRIGVVSRRSESGHRGRFSPAAI